MAVYVVTWNLNREANYDPKRTAFLNHLNRHENVADPALETVRWISTGLSADALSADLRQRLDGNDRIFVSHVYTGGHQGYLSKATWAWINQRL
ncbi:hypothetical protein D7U76_09790 [Stenotrophomonas maltophilia]|nr:hypothetical protein [Stenotrophomonas maltophilia]